MIGMQSGQFPARSAVFPMNLHSGTVLVSRGAPSVFMRLPIVKFRTRKKIVSNFWYNAVSLPISELLIYPYRNRFVQTGTWIIVARMQRGTYFPARVTEVDLQMRPKRIHYYGPMNSKQMRARGFCNRIPYAANGTGEYDIREVITDKGLYFTIPFEPDLTRAVTRILPRDFSGWSSPRIAFTEIAWLCMDYKWHELEEDEFPRLVLADIEKRPLNLKRL